MRITASELLRTIARLPRDRAYNYVQPKSTAKIEIVRATEPDGPIRIRRYDPRKGGTPATAKEVTISAVLLRRVANALREGVPINLDRVLGGSYNTRSVLESLLAHTPQFYYCYPGRIEVTDSYQKVAQGHKHLLWLPNDPHPNGVMQRRDVNVTISEVPSVEAVYEALVVPDLAADDERHNLGIDVARRHAQIQIALVEIGRQLGFRTWVAQNDQGIIYKGQRLGELEGVIPRLQDERLLTAYEEAVHAARLIDVVWFKNGRLMPAVIEIEHTTGVTSGLTRMRKLQLALPPFPTRWVIAAQDEDRDKVMQECNQDQFRGLDPRFFPYSSIEELYSLCQRRKIRGISDEFLDSFMERTLQVH